MTTKHRTDTVKESSEKLQRAFTVLIDEDKAAERERLFGSVTVTVVYQNGLIQCVKAVKEANYR